MELVFADGFNQSSSLPSMNRQCTNCYPKFVEAGDVVEKRLFGTPGLTQLATTGTSAQEANRGSHVMAGIVYFVHNISLSRLNEDETITNLSTLDSVDITGSGKVSMADNGTQLMILVPGGSGFIFNKDTAALEVITDSDFTANGLPQVVIFIDSFFMVVTDSKKFIISASNDGTSWDALDFGTAESDPDKIVGLTNFKNEAYIMGSETGEPQNNIGGTDFPFQRNDLFLDKGLFARFSIVNTTDTFMFIGGSVNEDPSIWSLQGNSLVQVSNTGIDLLLNSLTTTELDQVVAYTYAQDHSTFVAWELPNETIVYGVDTGKWHLRRSEVPDVAGHTMTIGWRATGLVTAYDKLICFDTQDGRIGEVSRDFFDEYGTNIQREFDLDPLRAEKRPFFIPRIEVTPEAGVGDAVTPDPKIRLKTSKNAQIFGGERIRSMGGVGEYDKRPVWFMNGFYPQYALLRFLFSEKVKFVIIRVDAEIKVGRL